MSPAAPVPVPVTAVGRPIALFYRVRLMLTQMLTVPLTAFCLLGLPPRPGAIVVAILILALWTAELRLSVHSPITAASALMVLSLAIVQHAWDLDANAIYVPAIFFTVLFLVGGLCLLRRRPASMYYSDGVGTPALHWWGSSIWVALYAAGAVIGLLLPWRPDAFWLPALVVMAGVAITLWLQFVDLGPAHRRARRHQIGALRIEEIEPAQAALVPFYTHYVREAAHSLKQGQQARRVSFDELLRLKMQSDAPSWPRTRFFAAYDGALMIGTISCTRRTSHAPLGVESSVTQPLRLQALAPYGAAMQVARFTIHPAYRQRQDVFRGLLGAVIEYALEQDIALVVTQAYPNVQPVYSKIGFIRLSEGVVQVKDTGAAVVLMAFNLARRVVCERNDSNGASQLVGTLNAYLSERYFKRQSLRSLLGFKSLWTLTDAALADLCRRQPARDTRQEFQHES